MITTQQATGNIDAAQRRVDMADKIYLLQPEEAPFAALLRKLSRKTTINPEFSWLEDEATPWVDAINNGAGYASGATSLVVDNGGYFAAGDLIKVFRTGETFRVTAVATNTLTVTRGWGSTAAALVDNDVLLVMGTAFSEGALAATARHTVKVKKFNYTQIFKTSVKLTKTLEASGLYAVSSERAFQRQKKAREHNWSINRQLWFGARNENLSATDAPIRSSGGITHFVTTNKTSLANDAAVTLAALDAFLESVFFYGSGTRWCFLSPHMATLINALGQAKLQLQHVTLGRAQENVAFGLSVTKYVSPHGICYFVYDRALKDWITLTGSNAAGKVMFALDFDPEEGIAYRPLTGRDTKFGADIQPPDADYTLDEYLTECGLQVGQEKRHGIFEVIA
jgi:hypothetical protein